MAAACPYVPMEPFDPMERNLLEVFYPIDEACHAAGIRTVIVGTELLFCAADLGKAVDLSKYPHKAAICANRREDSAACAHKRRRSANDLPDRPGSEACAVQISQSGAEKIAKAFGMTVLDNHVIPVETETIAYLLDVFRPLNMVPQYRVLGYRIDLYFPDQKVAVECDEKGGHMVLVLFPKTGKEKKRSRLACNAASSDLNPRILCSTWQRSSGSACVLFSTWRILSLHWLCVRNPQIL